VRFPEAGAPWRNSSFIVRPSAADLPTGRGATEEQDVAVRVFELEAAQTVVRILQWFRERDVSRRELGLPPVSGRAMCTS
jgi:hypothetical protein